MREICENCARNCQSACGGITCLYCIKKICDEHNGGGHSPEIQKRIEEIEDELPTGVVAGLLVAALNSKKISRQRVYEILRNYSYAIPIGAAAKKVPDIYWRKRARKSQNLRRIKTSGSRTSKKKNNN